MSAEVVLRQAMTQTVAADIRVDRRRLPRKIIVGACIVGIFALVAVLAPVLAPYSPDAQNVAERLEGPSSEHLLGTDPLGRDVLSRIIYAARVDIPVAILAVLFPALIGTLVGAVAGYRGGWGDAVVTGVASVVQAFPIYIFLIALVFSLGPGIGSVLIAFTAINWVVYALLIRGEVLRTRGLDYVQAAEVAGVRRHRILWRHIVPNAIRQTYIFASSDVVLAMIGFATLSYFGLGIEAPTAEWGSMISDGQDYLRTEPLLSVAPGFAITLIGVGFALIGTGLDDYLRR